jgi:hypothetical protein
MLELMYLFVSYTVFEMWKHMVDNDKMVSLKKSFVNLLQKLLWDLTNCLQGKGQFGIPTIV